MSQGADRGIEQGALYKRTEQLLREYNAMQARVKNLDLDLEGLDWEHESSTESIEGLTFARGNLEGLPRGNDVSDKTASVALKWRKDNDYSSDETWDEFVKNHEQMKYERDFIKRDIQKIDNAIASLSEDEQIIVRGFYIEQKPWYDVAHEVQYVERHCKRLRTRAIWYMSKSIFGARVKG